MPKVNLLSAMIEQIKRELFSEPKESIETVRNNENFVVLPNTGWPIEVTLSYTKSTTKDVDDNPEEQGKWHDAVNLYESG